MLSEARRQQALLAAIAAGEAPAALLRERGDRLAHGLAAYRVNADAIADRALGVAFPTVRAMLGEEQFARLASEFRRDRPPVRGDLGEWGDALADWIGQHEGLVDWPWLADSARLDFAVHRSERALDAAIDLASLERLQDVDPDRLRLRLMPGSALVGSAWPIATIHAAHCLEGAAADAAFEQVQGAIADRRGEQAWVARKGWRGAVWLIEPATAAWMADLLDGRSLGVALARAGADFDITAWLTLALREGWLAGLERID